MTREEYFAHSTRCSRCPWRRASPSPMGRVSSSWTWELEWNLLACQKLRALEDSFWNGQKVCQGVLIHHERCFCLPVVWFLSCHLCHEEEDQSNGVKWKDLMRPQYDEQQKLTRLRCRLLDDPSKEGWVTMKGNQGSDLLISLVFVKTWRSVLKYGIKALVVASRKEAMALPDLLSVTSQSPKKRTALSGKVFLDRLSPHEANQKSFERTLLGCGVGFCWTTLDAWNWNPCRVMRSFWCRMMSASTKVVNKAQDWSPPEVQKETKLLFRPFVTKTYSCKDPQPPTTAVCNSLADWWTHFLSFRSARPRRFWAQGERNWTTVAVDLC